MLLSTPRMIYKCLRLKQQSCRISMSIWCHRDYVDPCASDMLHPWACCSMDARLTCVAMIACKILPVRFWHATTKIVRFREGATKCASGLARPRLYDNNSWLFEVPTTTSAHICQCVFRSNPNARNVSASGYRRQRLCKPWPVEPALSL